MTGLLNRVAGISARCFVFVTSFSAKLRTLTQFLLMTLRHRAEAFKELLITTRHHPLPQ